MQLYKWLSQDARLTVERDLEAALHAPASFSGALRRALGRLGPALGRAP